MFPAEGDPKGGMAHTCWLPPWLVLVLIVTMVDPNYWTETELRRWLKLVCDHHPGRFSDRKLTADVLAAQLATSL